MAASARSEEVDPAPSEEQIQELIEKVESFPDPASRQLMQECLCSLLEFYGAGLERIMFHLDGDTTAREARDAALEEDIVRALLFVHGLHPVPVEERLAGALDSVRPYMESHGGDIELISIEEGIALLRLEGHCKSCPSSTVTMELAVRRAIEDACPDLDGIEVEGMQEGREPAFKLPPGAPAWHIVGSESELNGRQLQTLRVDGSSVMLARVGDQRYAYRDYCPSCHEPLDGAELHDSVLSCPRGHRFDLLRAGRCQDQPEVHLDPFPLITSGGFVKVAVS